MKKFENDIVLFGFGAVGQSVLSILEKEIEFDKSKLTIIDKEPEPFETGFKYVQAELRPLMQEEFFSPYLKKGDLLLDFSSETDCLECIKWCYEKGIMYINTGNNEWPEKGWKNAYQNYVAYQEFKDICDTNAATIITDHGANPGSVSHFAKKALFDTAWELIDGETDLDKSKLKYLVDNKKWGELAEYLEVRTIQSSDKDTQQVDPSMIDPNVFYSTWNPMTYYNETACEAEARIGTTEPMRESELVGLYDEKTGAIEYNIKGTEFYSKGWTPAGEYLGMVVGHEEGFSIPNCLSVYNEDGSLRYRPTTYFTYKASDAAVESIMREAVNGYGVPAKTKLLKEEIVSGTEYVGTLIMGNKFKSRWVGNCLTLERIAKYFPGNTPTILQVAIPALSAISYAVENRNKGLNCPDDLPYEEILPVIEKYAGKSISVTTDFTVSHNIFEDFIPIRIKQTAAAE